MAAVFSPAKNSMQLFTWQHDTVGVAHNILVCSASLKPCLMLLIMRPRGAPHLHQPLAVLRKYNPFSQSCRSAMQLSAWYIDTLDAAHYIMDC